MGPPQLIVKKLHPDAKLPSKKRDSDEGYDIFCIEDFTISPHCVVKAKTGISARVTPLFDFNRYQNKSYWLQIEGRSGLAIDNVYPVGGIIDQGYDGEIMVALINNNDDKGVTFSKGDKIAQLVIREHFNFPVAEVDDLGEVDRGDLGFGSSGR